MTELAPTTIGPEVTARLRARLEGARASLKQDSGQLTPMEGRPVVEAVTATVDDCVRELAATARQILDPEAAAVSESVRLIALGSYGRRELCPHSDVDLLFLLSDADGDRDAQGRFVNAVLYGLWDLGFEVGHAVRTVEECLEAAIEEQSVLSTLLDARQVDADPEDAVFKALNRGVDKLLF